jgi:hypothetical protein
MCAASTPEQCATCLIAKASAVEQVDATKSLELWPAEARFISTDAETLWNGNDLTKVPQSSQKAVGLFERVQRNEAAAIALGNGVEAQKKELARRVKAAMARMGLYRLA